MLGQLWQEYKAIHPEGYQYSPFCERYRQWAGTLDVCLRQEHKAGEKMFVDWAGQTVPVTDPSTGQTREAQIFVAVLGASNYTYAEATWTQALPDWIAAHIHAWEALGGVSERVVPDNTLKLLAGLSRTDLIILDDLGTEALGDAERHDLLEILEDRYERRPHAGRRHPGPPGPQRPQAGAQGGVDAQKTEGAGRGGLSYSLPQLQSRYVRLALRQFPIPCRGGEHQRETAKKR